MKPAQSVTLNGATLHYYDTPILGYELISPTGIRLVACWGFFWFDEMVDHAIDEIRRRGYI